MKVEHLIPGRAASEFEEALADQLSAVIFSEGQRRPMSPEGVTDYVLRTDKTESGLYAGSVLLSRGGFGHDYLFGDDQQPLVVYGTVPPRHINVCLSGDREDREVFETDMENGIHLGHRARLRLSATIRQRRNDNEDKYRSSYEQTYSFYELNPDHFAPVTLNRFLLQTSNLTGTIRKSAELMVYGPEGVIKKPHKHPVLKTLKAEFPVDMEKYDAKLAQIADEYGIRVRPYSPVAA